MTFEKSTEYFWRAFIFLMLLSAIASSEPDLHPPVGALLPEQHEPVPIWASPIFAVIVFKAKNTRCYFADLCL